MERPLPQLLKIQTVAECLDTDPARVYELVRLGELTAVRIGRRGLRICQDSVENFITQNKANEPL